MAAVRIAIIGAESTGKSHLTEALAEHLPKLTGLRCSAVPEVLRAWCETHQRTPRQDEQAAIAIEQARRIEMAGMDHDVVLCDTTPLMTAIYSQLIFGDDSLIPAGQAFHHQCQLTLLTGLDLPWVADGMQRDGPHVRQPVDAAIRRALLEAGLSWSTVFGCGPARLESALNAITASCPALLSQAPRPGLFTRLQMRERTSSGSAWTCINCDDPDCEHAAKVLRQSPASKAN